MNVIVLSDPVDLCKHASAYEEGAGKQSVADVFLDRYRFAGDHTFVRLAASRNYNTVGKHLASKLEAHYLSDDDL